MAPPPYLPFIPKDWIRLERIIDTLWTILNADTNLSDLVTFDSDHRHDTQTLQLDGVNSDGGAFTFNTTGTVTFNQSIVAAGLTVTNAAVIGSDSVVFKPNADSTTFFQVKDATGNGIFTLDSTNRQTIVEYSSASYPFVIKSTDGSCQAQIYHDNTNTYYKTTDGFHIFTTDEGTNTNAFLYVRGKGTGVGSFRAFDQDNVEYCGMSCFSGVGSIFVSGTSPVLLKLQSAANVPISMFSDAIEGETQTFSIFGFGTGSGGKESLDITVEKTTANTVEFEGLDNYNFTGTIKSTTGAQLGDGGITNYQNIDSTGDTWWTGTGGLVFGGMDVDAEFTVTIGDANPTEVAVTITGDGWSAGDLNKVTFPTGGTEHYLTVPVAGIYEVIWSLSVHKDAGPATAIHGGVMVDGVAQRNNGEAHADFPATDNSDCIGSPATVDCPNGTEQISLWTSNDQSNDVHIDHGTMLIRQVAGT